MYKHILVPTDGSPLSAKATDQAMDLAKAIGARITGMTVSIPFHTLALDPEMLSDTPLQYKEDCEKRARKFLDAVALAARAAGVPCDTADVTADHPYEGIIDTATSKGCDLIVMASHGRKGISGLVGGSETHKVLTHSKIPVLVCR